MAEERYWVQVAYQRKPVPASKVEPKNTNPPPVIPSTPPLPLDKIRRLTPEEEKAELEAMRATDHPRVRQIFDILDAPAKGQPLPEGIRLNQGDLVAPGLILDERPFPEWFHSVMGNAGFEYNKGNASFMLCVEGKARAESWYVWIMEVLRREKEYAASHKAPSFSETVAVYIREDHAFLWDDELTKTYT